MIKASRGEEASFLTSHSDGDEDPSALTSWSMGVRVEGITERRQMIIDEELVVGSKFWIGMAGVFLRRRVSLTKTVYCVNALAVTILGI